MSVSQTSSIPTLAGSFISLDMVKRATDEQSRSTKIICTLGPACWDVEQLELMMDAGMNVARFNFSHGDHEGHGACLERLRTAAKNKNKNCGVLLDTKGPEIRSGFFADGAKKIDLVKGETLILTSDYSFKGSNKKLACSYPSLAKSVTLGQQILVADGSLVLKVLSCDEAAGEVSCRIENNASIGERKNMNLPGVVVDLPTFTDKDKDDIVKFGIKNNVDFVAASFVRKAEDVTNLRKLLDDNGGSKIKIICKIENQEGLENYDAILAETDGIMVARGDLGMEIPPAKVFLAQKLMIRKANIAGKPVITATQMLESMIGAPRPTRAECSDVANAVLDGTDCVMLSGETANGPYFENAIRVMSRTCAEAEGSQNYNNLFQAVRNSVSESGSTSAGQSLASSAVKTAIDVKASIILVISESGTSAREVAQFRPDSFIVCLTACETVARQSTGVLKGVHAYVVDSLDDTNALVNTVMHYAVESGVSKVGDKMVVICGQSKGSGSNNLIKIEDIISGKGATADASAPVGNIRRGLSFSNFKAI